MMWLLYRSLMCSTMAARVVDLPEPVGPLAMKRPLGRSQNSFSTSGSPNDSMEGRSNGTIRMAAATEPRWRYRFTRNRESPLML
jgi:hypothetical protein